MTEVYKPGRYEMETASGLYVDVNDPDPATIFVGDIAHGLAQLNRYSGHARRPMSVADHTLLVVDWLRARGYGLVTQLRGLHHDDPETYANDLIRPVKLLMTDRYGPIEDRLEAAIVRGLSLPPATAEGWQAIKTADLWALAAEAWHLLPSRGEQWISWGLYHPSDPANPPRAKLLAQTPVRWQSLKARWLREHRELTRRVNDLYTDS